MAKQTMGTPFFCYPRRADNKIYRIITPQIPLVHTQALKTYNLEQYPLGTNAVVAVISATVSHFTLVRSTCLLTFYIFDYAA